MERPEYNKLRKMAKTTPGLIVDEAQNMMRVSLYDNGELKKVVVVMKCDSFLQSKSNIEKIMLLSSSIEDRKNKEKNKTRRHDRIWTTWSIAFDDLKVGDTVEFSTSGKYNPGFHATEKYVGCVEWIKGSECAIKTGNGMAVVLIKHIERVVK